jgi:hypothetical protein
LDCRHHRRCADVGYNKRLDLGYSIVVWLSIIPAVFVCLCCCDDDDMID